MHPCDEVVVAVVPSNVEVEVEVGIRIGDDEEEEEEEEDEEEEEEKFEFEVAKVEQYGAEKEGKGRDDSTRITVDPVS